MWEDFKAFKDSLRQEVLLFFLFFTESISEQLKHALSFSFRSIQFPHNYIKIYITGWVS